MRRLLVFSEQGKIDGEPFGPTHAMILSDSDIANDYIDFPESELYENEWVSLETANEQAETLELDLYKIEIERTV